MEQVQENTLDQIEKRNIATGLAFAIAGTTLFSLKSVLIKMAFNEGIDATTLLMIRMMIAMPFYLMVLAYAIKTRPQKAAELRTSDFFLIVGLGFMGYYLASYLDFLGLEYITAQLERLTLFTYPVMVALLSWIFFGEKITGRVFASLIISYLGVTFLFMNESSGENSNTGLGTLLVGGAALSFSLYVIFSKSFITRLGSLIFTSIAMSTATIWIVIQFFSTRDLSDLNVSPKLWLLGFLLAIFCTLIPSFFTSEAISRIGATRMSITGSIGPVVTILLAVWLLDEAFGWTHAIGLLMVMIGVGLLRAKKSPGKLISWIKKSPPHL
ncbi:DMT family transporter [Cocleimonas flava]|uniref:EamA domain-containing membrane protein RarD n=1 Tax=Cocleimonas flava TaxID=634765 RepID=A0A4R1F2X0_9GAMM|nr:DMT family transporter [Cocleimonas flava]TCJ88536.1 EamA domain-containing membrane protein RarD [Cocleimonas flava]